MKYHQTFGNVMRCAVTSFFVLIGAGGAGVALADTPSDTQQVITHHMQMINDTNLQGVLDDYASDAVVITAMGLTQGAAALRQMFTRVIRPGRAPLIIQRRFYKGDIGYVGWVQNAGKSDELHGSDTFQVRDGKIATQIVIIVNRRATAGR